ncbi:biotin/lipoyl-containing protein, partial [Vibrio anguillarum]|nr:oxaloacetate decarboxylase [Vibrio anguillarum]
GNIWKIHTKVGDVVEEGQVLLILEAMKMETEIRAARDGIIEKLSVSEGDSVQVGDALMALA